MHVVRIYYDGDIKSNTSITLDIKASHHILRVLRIHVGDTLVIFNGKTGEYSATLTAIKSKHAIVAVMAARHPTTESPVHLELAQGISRGERMDYTLQKAVELGVSKIVPLFTERCGVKLTDKRLENRLAHWHSIIIGACEQSGRCIIPQLASAQKLKQWLSKKRAGLKLLCNPDAKTTLSALPKDAAHVTVLIGPEGGLTAAELQSAKDAGFIEFSLGPRVLRTETAAVVALTLLQLRFGDLDTRFVM